MYRNILKYNCYASHNFCSSISFNKNGSCNTCSKIYETQTSDDLYKNYLSVKNIIIKKLKTFIEQGQNAIGKNAKAKIVLEMFDIISKHLYFMIENKNFMVTTIKKCIEFYYEQNIFDEILNSHPEYKFSRNFIMDISEFHKKYIKYDMKDGDNILNDFDVFMSDYMDNYIESNKETELNKSNKETEKIKNVHVHCDEIIHLDI